jgi:hypothetical protein
MLLSLLFKIGKLFKIIKWADKKEMHIYKQFIIMKPGILIFNQLGMEEFFFSSNVQSDITTL